MLIEIIFQNCITNITNKLRNYPIIISIKYKCLPYKNIQRNVNVQKIENYNSLSDFHQKPEIIIKTNFDKQTRYTLCIQSKRKSQGGFEFERKRREKGRQKPPPVPRTTFLQIVGTFYVASVDIYSEIPAVAGRLPFASMTSRGSTVLPSPEPVSCPCSCFGPLRESANPTSSTAYPTSSTYRSLFSCLSPRAI